MTEHNSFESRGNRQGGSNRRDGQRRDGYDRRSNNDDRRGEGRGGFGRRDDNNDRRDNRRDGERRSYGDRGRDGDRRSYGDRGRDGDRRSFGNRHSDGERRSYGDRGRDGDRRSFGDRDRNRDGDRRSYGNRDGGDRRRDGDRRSFGDRDRRDSRRDDRRDNGGRGDDRRHANRAGSDRGENRNMSHAQRPGYREERLNKRLNEPDLPSDIDVKDLDPLVLQDLKVLSKDNASATAKHMIMAATWLADDPQLALRHARAAKDRAGRIAVVRETCGIAAYHAGEWKEALSELRAARRMSGGPGLIAVMVDCLRGLGQPQKALELAREEGTEGLDRETQIELAIVVAGARQDLGQFDSAVTTLEQQNPDGTKIHPSYARLSYAYADTLAAAGRIDDARTWFTHAAAQDEDGILDADERLRELG
ncbi:hypothetical protein P4N68_01415 [Corynebacterium felinum]|uniref:Tetratricopeptide repeat protein n=1 Tax=Corynebacterium felinum TaxID=131318 RepID=A0ABU2BA95_9CORY|nr:hypothetical protein [Corynebacterium felinum]MDF5819739.1 hypothetical protein [Corynebacterium felinum]MDR7355542.1 hypothetical protein [Corynebacterium felinum]WJY94892.1 hypothetical protein CFELI_06375 [Corynebacterium felinum]